MYASTPRADRELICLQGGIMNGSYATVLVDEE